MQTEPFKQLSPINNTKKTCNKITSSIAGKLFDVKCIAAVKILPDHNLHVQKYK